jgi:simple sugar transport system permease protein
MDIIAGLLQTSILAGGVLALAALGEVLSERVGVVNLGVEGLMALGAITAIAIVTATPNPVLGLIGALGVGFLVGIIFASATVILRANQVLCGLATTLMGTGLAATIGKAYSGMPARATFAPVAIP